MRHITSWQRQAGSSTTWRVPASRFAMAQCQDRPGRRSVIHLDSSFLIDLLRETTRERPGGALEFIESLPDDEVLAISVHVLAELRAGAELAKQPLREHEELDRLCSGLVVSYPDDRFAPPTPGSWPPSSARAAPWRRWTCSSLRRRRSTMRRSSRETSRISRACPG
jgi:hypothetical protein